MTVYAVIDTNVLVSAMLKWSSIPGRVLSRVFSGDLVPVVDGRILEEYHEVLMRPKFHFPADAVREFLEEFEGVCISFAALADVPDLIDPKDTVFYAVTLSAREVFDAYLVTGNTRHFPVDPFVVTPREILDLLETKPAEKDGFTGK